METSSLEKDINLEIFSENEVKHFIRLRWMVISIIAFIVLLDNWNLSNQSKYSSILVFFCISNSLIQIFSKKIYQINYFIDAIFIIDTVLVTLLLYSIGRTGSDFYIIFYFLIIVLVSLNQDVRTVIVMGAIVSLIYGWLLFSLGILSTNNLSYLFLRISLVFLITLFYSYIINRINTSKEETQKYKLLSMHDELTGLPNRRYLNEYIKWGLKRIFRYKKPITFLMIDIDNFKSINDKYGHDTGDFILKEVATILQNSKRKSDLVVRYGGEEFLWITPETDEKDAYFIADRMVNKLRESVFKVNNHYLKITVSIGASTFLPQKHSVQAFPEVLNKADEALYQAKYQGKDNCIFLNCA